MPYYKFKPNDIFHNQIKAHPKCEFFIYDCNIYYNNRPAISGSHVAGTPLSTAGHMPTGHISLHELNIDRPEDGRIYPYVTKDGTFAAFKSVGSKAFSTEYGYGDKITGSYPMSASIYRDYFALDSDRRRIHALKNTFRHYMTLSRDYEWSGTLGDKSTQELNLLSIPSIFYGSSIKKGTVDLKFYITGTLIGHLKDERQNGQLVQVAPEGSTGSGSCAGVVLYKEGFIALTGTWGLDVDPKEYLGPGEYATSSWVHFAVGANDCYTRTDSYNSTLASASYELNFSGTTYTPVVTMMAHAPRGHLNHSNNPTYVTGNLAGVLGPMTASYKYSERSMEVHNTISSSYTDPTGSFRKQTFISKVGIYDERKNLIAVATLATPVKKTEEDEYTFKLKLDI